MTNKQTILIIEDEKHIGNYMETIVIANQYKALRAMNGLQGLSLCTSHHPDLILLDLGLPDIDGMEVLQRIRGFSNIPVIVVSARNQEREKVEVLDGGADDYITKPFRPLVLGAKVKALIRRNKDRILDHASALECGPFSYQYTTMRFFKNGKELDFSSRESALFLLFLQNPGQIFTKDMIYEAVWGNSVAVDDNAIMVYINRLRSKIEDDRQKPAHILTVRGLGYRFVP